MIEDQLIIEQLMIEMLKKIFEKRIFAKRNFILYSKNSRMKRNKKYKLCLIN